MTRPKNLLISYELFLDMIDYIADHPDTSDHRLDDIINAVAQGDGAEVCGLAALFRVEGGLVQDDDALLAGADGGAVLQKRYVLWLKSSTWI